MTILRWCVLLGLVLLPGQARADLWSSVLSASRGIDWTTAGADPIKMNAVLTQCGTTMDSTSTSAQILTRLTSCVDGVVQLGAGTFTLNAGLLVQSRRVLRGMGADQTKLVFTGGLSSGCADSVVICLSNQDLIASNPGHVVAWTDGLSRGSTQVTLANTAGLAVDQLIGLDQRDDAPAVVEVADNGNIWFCWSNAFASPPVNICSSEGVVTFRYARNNLQIVRVTALPADNATCANTQHCVVTITPGVYMPNFVIGRTPQAWWGAVGPARYCGIENLSMDVTTTSPIPSRVLEFYNARDCWLKGVRMVNDRVANVSAFVSGYATSHITVRDSYFYGSSTGGSGNYGTNIDISSDWLIENNIWERIGGPMEGGQSLQGTVWGYNYSLDNRYTAGNCTIYVDCNWMIASGINHAIGHTYNLYEGNDGVGFNADTIHGPSFLNVNLRNRWMGWDPLGGSNPSTGKTLNTIPVNISASNRYYSWVGNVLGHVGKHTAYEGYPNDTTTAGCATHGTINATIFIFGFSGQQCKSTNADSDPAVVLDNDPRVRDTSLRWGNYDVVTGLPRWCGNASNTRWATASPTGCASTSEVPTADAYYPNTIPAAETVPNSFYLAAKPPWFGSVTWPPIGPDVTGGPSVDGQALGGHVYKIPARLCYESMIDDPAYTGATVKVFNAASCLNATPPAVPTFGNTTVGTLAFDTSSAVPLFSKFTAPALNGRTISKLTVYLRDHTGGSFALGGAVYANNGGFAGAKLCEDTGNVTVTGSTPAWYEIPISCAFTTGQVLWLGIWPDTANRMTYNYEATGGVLNYKATAPAFETWPDPNTGTNTETWALSIYATYNAIASELEPPSDMANLAAGSPTTTTAPLTWDAGNDAQGAITSSIEICPGAGCTNYVTAKTGVTGTSTTLTTLTPATLYRIRGWHVDTNSNPSVNRSSVVTFTTATEPTLVVPAKPTGLRIAQQSNSAVTLIWSPNTESDLVGYHVWRSTIQGSQGTIIATRTPATAASAHNSITQYTTSVTTFGTVYFTVTAYDTDGNESDIADPVIANMTGLTARAARQ